MMLRGSLVPNLTAIPLGKMAFPDAFRMEPAWRSAKGFLFALAAGVCLLAGSIVPSQGAESTSLDGVIRQTELMVASYEKSLGAEHAATGSALQKLAVLLRQNCEYEKALSSFQRALQIRLKGRGEENAETAETLSGLGGTYLDLGDHGGAERPLRRALEIREGLFGPESAETGMSVAELGDWYLEKGNLEKADELFARATAIFEKSRGPNSVEMAFVRQERALLCFKKGEYSEAEALCKNALQIRDRSFGAAHPFSGHCLLLLGRIYIAQGRYAEAGEPLDKALQIHLMVLKGRHPKFWEVVRDVAQVYTRTGQYGSAESVYEGASLFLEARSLPAQPADGPESRKAKALDERAIALFKSGNLKEALIASLESLNLRERTAGENDIALARSLNNAGEIELKLGDYEEAERLLRRAVAQAEKALGGVHRLTATYGVGLGSLYLKKGAYADAEMRLSTALETFEKVLPAEHPQVAVCIAQLAALYAAKEDFAKASALQSRAVELSGRALGEGHPVTETFVSTLAQLQAKLGKVEEAHPLILSTLSACEKRFGEEHVSTAKALAAAGDFYLKKSDYQEAESFLARALAVRQKLLGFENAETLSVAEGLADVYEKTGRILDSEKMWQRVFAAVERTQKGTGIVYAQTLLRMGEFFVRAGQFAKAEPLFTKAFEIREKVLGLGSFEVFQGRRKMALLQLDRGNKVAALAWGEKAEDSASRGLAQMLSFGSSQEKNEFRDYRDWCALAGSLGNAALAARASLNWKGLTEDSLLEEQILATVKADAGLGEKVSSLRLLRGELYGLMRQISEEPNEVERQSLLKKREVIKQKADALESGITRAAPEYGHTRKVLTTNFQKIQGSLAPNEILVDFIRYAAYLGRGRTELRYGAVVQSSKGSLQWVGLGAASELEEIINQASRSLRSREANPSGDALQQVLKRLYAKVWAPVAKAVPGGIQNVVLCPDGDLERVPFAALLGSDDRFLAETVSIRYVSAPRDLLKSPPPANIPGKVVFYGNAPQSGPELAAGRDEGDRALKRGFYPAELKVPLEMSRAVSPSGANECEALARLLETSGASLEMRLGSEANEASLKEIKSQSILHLSLRSYALEDAPNGLSGIERPASAGMEDQTVVNPLDRCGLLLAGAQRTLDHWSRGEGAAVKADGVLTAYELGALNLAGTAVVALSLIESDGDEIGGAARFRRGFIKAGAANVLQLYGAENDLQRQQVVAEFYSATFRARSVAQSFIEVQRRWLIKLRSEYGIQGAVRAAGNLKLFSTGKTQEVNSK